MNELPRYIQFGRRVWDRVNVTWYGEWYTGEIAWDHCDALNRADRAHRIQNPDTSYLRMVWRKTPMPSFGSQNMMYS